MSNAIINNTTKVIFTAWSQNHSHKHIQSCLNLWNRESSRNYCHHDGLLDWCDM